MIGGFPLQDLRDLFRRLLHDECLPFWRTHGWDRETGGFFPVLPGQSEGRDAVRHGWDQGRGIYIHSRAYNRHVPHPDHLKAAQQSRDFMLRHGRDDRGDWVNGLTRDGRVTTGAVSIYTDIYLMHGLVELFQADGDPEDIRVALETARRVGRRIQAADFRHSLAVYRRPHRVNAVWFLFLSALTDLLRFRLDSEMEALADLCVRSMLENHLDPRTGLFLETLAPDGARFPDDQGHEVMPGHSAQACWMLMDEARRRKDPGLTDRAVEILRSHIEASWDAEHGGIPYLIDIRDLHVVDPAKNAWQQQEFLIALMEACERTGPAWASAWYGRLHKWAFARLPDPRHGLWHTLADRQGLPPATPSRKDLYHYPRMLMRVLESLDRQVSQSPP